MNKRQHKKWVKRVMQKIVLPINEADAARWSFKPVYGTKYLVSNDTRLLFRDFMELLKKKVIVEVQWCKKKDKPNIVQDIPYVCLVTYLERYDVVR